MNKEFLRQQKKQAKEALSKRHPVSYAERRRQYEEQMHPKESRTKEKPKP